MIDRNLVISLYRTHVRIEVISFITPFTDRIFFYSFIA